MYKTIDLCAGIGGLRKGFELTNRFKNIFSVENDKFACITYQHLYGENPEGDISDDKIKLEINSLDFDVLLAGFPCQTFSAVGNREGFKDQTRGTLFFHIAQIIESNRPKAFLLENVEGLLTHKKGTTFNIILNRLIKELNYEIIGVDSETLEFDRKSILLNAKNFGLPQNRPRVYIMGFDKNIFKDIDFDNKNLPTKNHKCIYKNVNDLLDVEVDDKYYLAQGYLDTLKKHKDSQSSKGNGFGYMIVNKDNGENPISNALLATGGSGKERNLIYQYKKGVVGKIVPPKQSPINSEYIRNMTPNEWAKLQGFKDYAFVENNIDYFDFPDKLSDMQRYKQLGNSVSIPTVESLAEFMLSIFNEQFKKECI